MSLRDIIYARARGDQKAKPRAALTTNVSYEQGRIPDLSTVERQANLFANMVWIQLAISRVAQRVASTPFLVKQLGAAEPRAIDNHPFVDSLLRNPNDLQSRFEFIEATCAWRKTTGNCYWWLNRSGPDEPPVEAWIIPSDQIQPIPDGNMGLAGYYYYPGGTGQEIPLETWEVVHFKTFNPLSPYVGLSELHSIALDSIGDIAAQKYNTGFYAKDNAKPDGILAFADAIDDGRWKRVQADWAEQHGGTKQKRMAMLRHVGAGGVQWIQTQLSRVEIQYLEQRTFTKEEVFAMLAPGLASILAVNATEANSTAGMDTFLSMAVYPQHVAIAETITKVVLPSYGPNLLGEFESVIRVDTQIELQEQDRFERTHTIDEVRAKYYQDKALGDARGDLLIAEVGSGMTDARAPEDKPTPVMPAFGAQPPPSEQAVMAAGKALDRRRWQTKAMKAVVAGRGADVPFDPDFLTDDEAMAIRGALKRATGADDVWRALGEG